ncbi:MAG: DUF177 domain-containing protein [Lachnospiraceae bacterium]|nr:DUF177 domain-containing protein [Lachnospiraceae bacterium]
MNLDLSEFLSVSDKKGHFDVPIEMEKFQTKRTSNRIADKSLVSIDFRNCGKKKVHMDASFSVTIIFPCDRCLEDVSREFKVDVNKDIDLNLTDEDRIEQLDEITYINETYLDVEKFVYNELLVNLPMKVLCKNDCKGICNRCGVNLNSQSCDCDTNELDPRMSKILDIFNNFKEV